MSGSPFCSINRNLGKVIHGPVEGWACTGIFCSQWKTAQYPKQKEWEGNQCCLPKCSCRNYTLFSQSGLPEAPGSHNCTAKGGSGTRTDQGILNQQTSTLTQQPPFTVAARTEVAKTMPSISWWKIKRTAPNSVLHATAITSKSLNCWEQKAITNLQEWLYIQPRLIKI